MRNFTQSMRDGADPPLTRSAYVGMRERIHSIKPGGTAGEFKTCPSNISYIAGRVYFYAVLIVCLLQFDF